LAFASANRHYLNAIGVVWIGFIENIIICEKQNFRPLVAAV